MTFWDTFKLFGVLWEFLRTLTFGTVFLWWYFGFFSTMVCQDICHDIWCFGHIFKVCVLDRKIWGYFTNSGLKTTRTFFNDCSFRIFFIFQYSFCFGRELNLDKLLIIIVIFEHLKDSLSGRVIIMACVLRQCILFKYLHLKYLICLCLLLGF